jgi:hypothetical protein
MTEDRTPEDRTTSFRANNQRAIAALEAVAPYAQTAPGRPALSPPEPTRNEIMSGCPGCCTESGISATSSPGSASTRSAVPQTSSTRGPGPLCRGSSAGAEAAAVAIDIYELTMPAQMRRPGSRWPLDTLAVFDSYPTSRGISREAATARLSSGLVTSPRTSTGKRRRASSQSSTTQSINHQSLLDAQERTR